MPIKNVYCITIVFLSLNLCAQKSASVRDFLPDLFYTKQSLMDHYQYSDLNYKAMLANLESKPGEAVQIIYRDTSQIIYTDIYSDQLKPDTTS